MSRVKSIDTTYPKISKYLASCVRMPCHNKWYKDWILSDWEVYTYTSCEWMKKNILTPLFFTLTFNMASQSRDLKHSLYYPMQLLSVTLWLMLGNARYPKYNHFHAWKFIAIHDGIPLLLVWRFRRRIYFYSCWDSKKGSTSVCERISRRNHACLRKAKGKTHSCLGWNPKRYSNPIYAKEFMHVRFRWRIYCCLCGDSNKESNHVRNVITRENVFCSSN